MADMKVGKALHQDRASRYNVLILGVHMHGEPVKATTEEPEIVQEEAIPSDGKDVEGEEMMKLVYNDKLDVSESPALKGSGQTHMKC